VCGYCIPQAAGQQLETTYIEVYDMQEAWYYNTDEGFLPYIPENGDFSKSIAFHFDPHRYPENYLSIRSPYNTAIFFNGALKFNSKDSLYLNLSADSLSGLYDSPIVISVFSPLGITAAVETKITKRRVAVANTGLQVGAMSRSAVGYDHLTVIILLLSGLIILLSQTEKRTFSEFYSLILFSMGRVRDDSVYKLKLFDWPNLGFFLFQSALITWLLLLLERFYGLEYSFQLFAGAHIYIRWITITLMVFMSLVVKYLLIKNLGSLFDLKSSASYYFFEYMRMSMIFFGSIGLALAIFLIRWPDLMPDVIRIVLHILMAFLALRFIVIFIRIGKLTPFKNLHLFSYLCTTEILPIVIGINYFLNNS